MLEPCPVCGCACVTESFEDSAHVKEHYVICYLPVCRTRGPIRGTQEEAIAAWNAWPKNAAQVLGREKV